MIKILEYGAVSNSDIFARENPTVNVEATVSEIIRNVRLRGDAGDRQISMPEHMRRGVIKIDCFTDPLPSPDKGSFCDRPQTIPDDKSVDLSV